MLSQHDRMALAGIEQRFRESDPEFADRLEHAIMRRPRCRRLLWLPVTAILIAGAVLLAAALVVHNTGIAIAAALVLLTGTSGAVLCTVSAIRPRS